MKLLTAARRSLTALVLVVASLVAFNSCSTLSIEEFKDSTPQLDIVEYFTGNTTAYGMVFDRSGKPIRSFTAKIVGTATKDGIILDESFVFNDGERQKRVWTLSTSGESSFQGVAGDVVGVAQGRSMGRATNFTYTLALKAKGSTWNIKLDDWMFLHESGVLFNRATMSKFGFKVGELILFFEREKPRGQ